MKPAHILPALAGAVLMTMAPASAAPVIQYQILDGSVVIGSGASTTGSIALNGADSRFITAGGFASSAPLMANPDFSSSVFSIQSAASNTPATLTFRITTTGLTDYSGGSLLNTLTLNSLNGGSFTSGTISTYFDNSDTAYGTGTLLTTNTFTGLGSFSNSSLVSVSPSATFSETAIYTLNYSSGQASTVSASAQVSAVAAVPEPASWALMIVGFGFVGGGMRRRTKNATTFA